MDSPPFFSICAFRTQSMYLMLIRTGRLQKYPCIQVKDVIELFPIITVLRGLGNLFTTNSQSRQFVFMKTCPESGRKEKEAISKLLFSSDNRAAQTQVSLSSYPWSQTDSVKKSSQRCSLDFKLLLGIAAHWLVQPLAIGLRLVRRRSEERTGG